MYTHRVLVSRVVVAFVAIWILILSIGVAYADTSEVSGSLVTHDVFIDKQFYQNHLATPADLNRLQGAVYNAAKQGATEKIALVWKAPPPIRTAAQEASALRNFLGLRGVVIVVAPRGIGLSSDSLSRTEMTDIARRAGLQCGAVGRVACAIYASQQAALKVQDNKNSANRNAAIFWGIAILVFGGIVVVVVVYHRRKGQKAKMRLDELRTAASNTLSLADNAVTDIESAPVMMPAEVRTEYDGALGLRDRARAQLDSARTPEALTQANEDAAHAVLALQGVTKQLNINSPLSTALDVPKHKCFYCGREDRPPYMKQTIDDGKGHTMEVEICSVDAQHLQQGRTPQIQTVQYGGMAVPWWAVPTSPWYYGYGGSSWQYWLPFLIGMDVGGWFGGGWGGGYGYGDYDAGYGQGYDQGYDSSGAGDAPQDAGGMDWGGSSGGTDWGSSSGGSDWGSGGGDFGGGGGGDFGGGGGDFGGGGGGDFGS